ncbi:hypothetical protein PFISCL1PPCAC_2068 [Pristionchus fissidentatus]|uniref:DM domain-containing protein n=1 Tax=Pristionchus fissidentatus TaxID=1538716 RepID=A0AAV5UU40_9BILA|nr:hypothetical protein PFISCL1PPCAC_2068 [Pristionchus fissidentatus]
MPKEQYMCQLCANHEVFNQPKKGHKQKCPHRECPCDLCALNTKRRALDQIERQLKDSTPASSSSSSPKLINVSIYSFTITIKHHGIYIGEIDKKVSLQDPTVSPSDLTSLSSLTPFSSLFTSSSPFFPPFFQTSPPTNFISVPSLGSVFLPPSFLPSSSSCFPYFFNADHNETICRRTNSQPSVIHLTLYSKQTSPYSVALPATISRKGMREALKNRSITAAIENIRAKTEAVQQPSEVDRSKSIFHSVEQLAG